VKLAAADARSDNKKVAHLRYFPQVEDFNVASFVVENRSRGQSRSHQRRRQIFFVSRFAHFVFSFININKRGRVDDETADRRPSNSSYLAQFLAVALANAPPTPKFSLLYNERRRFSRARARSAPSFSRFTFAVKILATVASYAVPAKRRFQALN
jgi:hypothetical protein